jgi:TPR repeat protein
MRRAILAVGLLAALVVAAGGARADVARGWEAFLKGDYTTALAELEPAAQAGDPAAQYYLGVLYGHGEGVVRNYRTAAEWYEKAALQGHPDAQFSLGLLFYDGAGSLDEPSAVPQDPVAATRWLTPAAEAGHGMASYLLCRLVDQGRAAARDLGRALGLCRYAAQRGIPGAQYHTGLLLAELKTDRTTWTEAYAWFLLAKRANYPGADQNLEIVARWLEPEDLARARAAAEEFKPLAGQ